MSIWAEIKHAINSTLGTATFKPLNEQLRDLKFQEIKIITSSGTYTPTKTGLYKVICVGAGGDGDALSGSGNVSPYAASGGGGGVAISTLALSSSGSYTVTVSSTASFVYSDEITLTATAGGNGSKSSGGSGGTASGGDNNYTGTDGVKISDKYTVPQSGGVSVYISGLSYTPAPIFNSLKMYVSSSYTGTYAFALNYGECLLGFGGGGTGACSQIASSTSYNGSSSSGRPAAIIIVPLELEG